MIEITFLGTSCMKPTKDRNPASIFLEYNGEGILFDCGEGTQRQMRLANLKPSKISKILISHWHGDHVLGLPGLIQTIGSEGYEGTLEIYGPKGSISFFENMKKSFYFDTVMNIKVKEISKGIFFESKDYYLEAALLEHGVVNLGFSFIEKNKRRINVAFLKKKGIPEGPHLGRLQDGKNIEWKGKKINFEEATNIVKGKKIVYITDTLLTKNCYILSKDADLLISEAVYTEEMKEKAIEHHHMTASQSAHIANESNVKKLVLTHLSQRFKSTEPIENEAKTYFSNVVCAYDLMKIKV